MSDLYLAHHGRMFQKWGIRNGPPYPLDKSETKNYKTKQNIKTNAIKSLQGDEASADYLLSRKKDIYKLSNDELNTMVKRMQLEKQLVSELSTSKGESFVDKTNSKMKKAQTFVASAAGIATSTAIVLNKWPEIKEGISKVI